MTPLIDFLDFVNNSSDAEFADGIASRLDVEAFARYLAFEELVDNFDDIDGPGNNAYLRWDAESQGFTVVADAPRSAVVTLSSASTLKHSSSGSGIIEAPMLAHRSAKYGRSATSPVALEASWRCNVATDMTR